MIICAGVALFLVAVFLYIVATVVPVHIGMLMLFFIAMTLYPAFQDYMN